MEEKQLQYNLQFFAESDGTGAEDISNGDGTETNKEKETSKQDEVKTFDEILSNKEYQSEFDRRLQKAIQTAVTGEKEKWETRISDKLTESEKLSKMNKEEKAEYLRQQKEKELLERESKLVKMELMAEAKNTLSNKNIPTSLADLLVYTDADACKQSIQTLEKAWQTSIEKGIEERLKGGKPLKKATETDNQKILEQQIYDMMSGK